MSREQNSGFSWQRLGPVSVVLLKLVLGHFFLSPQSFRLGEQLLWLIYLDKSSKSNKNTSIYTLTLFFQSNQQLSDVAELFLSI